MRVKDIFKTEKERILVFSPKLYLGESIKSKKLDTIKRRLLTKPLLAGVTLLVLSENDSDQLDILNCVQLAQKAYGSYPLYVAGLARNHDEAVELVVRITEECLASRKDCSLKEYLRWQ